MSKGDELWSQKGATMSDKSARQEFGLTQPEIIAAIRASKLQYRESSMHGNPWIQSTVTDFGLPSKKALASASQSQTWQLFD